MLDRIGIVRALFGMLYADSDVLATTAGFSNTVGTNGTVQRAGDNLGIGSGVVEHLFFDGLCTLLQRAVHARAELQIERHVGQVVLQINLDCEEMCKTATAISKRVLRITENEIRFISEELEKLFPMEISVYYEECIFAMQEHIKSFQ